MQRSHFGGGYQEIRIMGCRLWGSSGPEDPRNRYCRDTRSVALASGALCEPPKVSWPGFNPKINCGNQMWILTVEIPLQQFEWALMS